MIDKPYVEMKESDGRPDEEVSRESWENHLKRNRSEIVDLFQGQLKRLLTLPVCHSAIGFFRPLLWISLINIERNI